MADITMLDLPAAASISGSEWVWIVQGGTSKRTQTGAIATINNVNPALYLPTTMVTSGATYAALTTDVLIVINKTVGSPTTVVLPLSTTKSGLYYIKDGKGDAATNNITIDASGGELFDGQSSIPITSPYGVATVAPNPSGGWLVLNFG